MASMQIFSKWISVFTLLFTLWSRIKLVIGIINQNIILNIYVNKDKGKDIYKISATKKIYGKIKRI